MFGEFYKNWSFKIFARENIPEIVDDPPEEFSFPSSLSGLGTGDVGGDTDWPKPENGTTLPVGFVGELRMKKNNLNLHIC